MGAAGETKSTNADFLRYCLKRVWMAEGASEEHGDAGVARHAALAHEAHVGDQGQEEEQNADSQEGQESDEGQEAASEAPKTVELETQDGAKAPIPKLTVRCFKLQTKLMTCPTFRWASRSRWSAINLV